MLCETCLHCINISGKWYYNEHKTNLLCIFNKIPNDIINYIGQYLYNVGHVITYYDMLSRLISEKDLCTSCFQMGFYKLMHSSNNISFNMINYFDCWNDDDSVEEVREFCSKYHLPIQFKLSSSIIRHVLKDNTHHME